MMIQVKLESMQCQLRGGRPVLYSSLLYSKRFSQAGIIGMVPGDF